MDEAASPLDALRVSKPCPMDWNAMAGDDRRRFCSECKLHVVNLAALTRKEAEATLGAAASGRLCIRIERDADGRTITRDRRRRPVAFVRRLRAVAALVLGWAGINLASGCKREDSPRVVLGTRSAPNPEAESRPAETRPTVELGDFAAPAAASTRPSGR